MSKPVFSLSYSSMLTEDYIHTDSILASAKATAPLATFLNGQGQSEALVVFDDGELCHLQREPLSSSGWNFNGIGYQIGSITAANRGSVWMMDTDQSIWMTNTGHWNELGTQPEGGMSLSAGLDGTVYKLGQLAGSVHLSTFDLTSGSFIDQGAVPITSAPLGNPDSLFALSHDKLYTNANGSWRAVYAQFASGDIPYQLSVGSDGLVWILCQNGAIYSYDPATGTLKKLTDVPVNAQHLAAADAKTLYVLNSNPHLENQLQTNETGTWKEIAYPVSPIVEISIGNDGVLWARDQNGRLWILLDGKWVRQIMPTDQAGFTGGHNVREVVTGTHNNGGIEYAFFTMEIIKNSGVYDLFWSRLVTSEGPYGGYWTSPVQLFSGCSNIATVNDPDSYQLLVYGVSDKGNFVLVQDAGGEKWAVTEIPMKTSLSGVKPVFLYDGSWLTYAIIQDKDKKGKLFVGSGSLKSPAATLNQAKYIGWAPSVLQTIAPFETSCHGTSGTLLVAIDDQDQVLTISGASGTVYFDQLTWIPDGVASVVGMLVPKDGARIYASDKVNNLLWINRQTAAVKNKAPQPDTIVWSDWHPLGNECTVLATGCTIPPPDAPSNPPVDLFSLDLGFEVNVLSEDPVTGALTDLVMLKPDGTNNPAEYVTRYVSEITVVDENNMPQPTVEVDITADEPIGIWVGNNLYNVSSQMPASFTTNGYGKVTFSFFAADLHTPTFSFKADSLDSPPTFSPADAVHKYLKGSPTVLPNRPVFTSDGSALVTAQMQTGPGWSTAPTKFVVGKDNTDRAPKVAKTIGDIYTFPITGGPSGQWSVAPVQPTGVSASSFWHELCKFPHDIEHAIRKAAMKVKDIVVAVADGVVKFTMELANGLSQVLHLAINTFKDMVSAVKSAFRFIERGVDEVINWLKSLFNWTDVLSSKRVLEALLNGMMTKMGENLDPSSPVYVRTLVDKLFGDFETAILGGFDKAKAKFEKTQSISTAANSSPYPEVARPMGDDPLSPTNTNNAQSSNGSQTNFVHTHVSNYNSQGGGYPPSAMGDGSSGDSVLKVLIDAIEKNLNEGKFKDEQMKSVDSLKSLFSDPKNFFNVVIYDILTAVEDLVDILLKVIQGVIDALLTLAGNALKGLQNLLNKPIDIPVISWIYKEISQHQLTMLDLFCLMIATPSTILYKLTFGLPNATPPFTVQEADDIVAELSDPATFPWPVFPGTGAAVSSLAGKEPTDAEKLAFTFLPALGLFNSIMDAFCDVVAKQLAVAWEADQITFWKAEAKSSGRLSIMASMLGHFLSAPFNLFAKSDLEIGEGMQLALWGSGFLLIVNNFVFAMASPEGAPAKFNEKYGVRVATALGMLVLVAGIATSGEQLYQHFVNGKKLDIFQNVANMAAPVPSAMVFLLNQGVEAIVGLIAVDVLFDIGSTVLSTISMYYRFEGIDPPLAST